LYRNYSECLKDTYCRPLNKEVINYGSIIEEKNMTKLNKGESFDLNQMSSMINRIPQNKNIPIKRQNSNIPVPNSNNSHQG